MPSLSVGGLEDTVGSASGAIGDWWNKRSPHGYKSAGDPNAASWGPAAEQQAMASTSPGFFGAGQQSLAEMLMAQANGQGPNLAQAQLKQATDRNLAQAAGLQASARGGGNTALQARSAQQQQAGIAQEAAGQSAITRMQEEENARNALGGVLASGRQADLTGQGMANQAGQYYAGLGLQNALGSQGITAGAQSQNNGLLTQMLGSASSGLGGALAMLKDGGTVPGADSGEDDKLIAARGGEVVVPPENPIYPAARAAVEQASAPAPAKRQMPRKVPAMPAREEVAMPVKRFDSASADVADANRYRDAWLKKEMAPAFDAPHPMLNGSPAGSVMVSPATAPTPAGEPGHPMGRAILDWLRKRQAEDLGGIGRMGMPESAGTGG